MTRAADTLDRAVVALGDRMWWVAALVVPLVVVAGAGVPDATGVLLACAVAVLAAAAPRSTAVAARVVPGRRAGAVLAPPTPTSRIPDPVRHPLSPRAPGQV